MEKQLEKLVPVKVGYQCDSCKEGFMYPTENSNIEEGFEHKCNHCGDIKVLPTLYPTVNFLSHSEVNISNTEEFVTCSCCGAVIKKSAACQRMNDGRWFCFYCY